MKILETWGKIFESNKKMAKNGEKMAKKGKKLLKKMAKIGGKILVSNIYLCKKIDISQLWIDLGRTRGRDQAIIQYR